MNFINIFVTTMIIGIGVDYAVYVLHRYREVGGASGKEVERGLVETGNAVVMASLSTILGFGSITFSSYPGLQSTGKVAILGAFCACFVTITLLPAWLAWRHVEVEPVAEGACRMRGRRRVRSSPRSPRVSRSRAAPRPRPPPPAPPVPPPAGSAPPRCG